MGMEVGGGFRMGSMCTPMADSCWCMVKPIQYCKVKRKKKDSGGVNLSQCLLNKGKKQSWSLNLSGIPTEGLPYFKSHFLGFPGGSVVKNPPANAGDTGSIPRSGKSPGETQVQSLGQENPLEKEMATRKELDTT